VRFCTYYRICSRRILIINNKISSFFFLKNCGYVGHEEDRSKGTGSLYKTVILCSHNTSSTFILSTPHFQISMIIFTQQVQGTTRTRIIPRFQTRSAKPMRALPISQAVYVFRRKTSPRIQNSVPRSALSLGSLSDANLRPVSCPSQAAPARHRLPSSDMVPRLNVSGEILISFPPT